jgi:fungal nitric oxide reductase
LVEQRIAKPKDDLISKLVVEQVRALSALRPFFFACSWLTTPCSRFQLIPGNIQKSDAVQMAFLMLVAGNATMVNMINLVGSISVKIY